MTTNKVKTPDDECCGRLVHKSNTVDCTWIQLGVPMWVIIEKLKNSKFEKQGRLVLRSVIFSFVIFVMFLYVEFVILIIMSADYSLHIQMGPFLDA